MDRRHETVEDGVIVVSIGDFSRLHVGLHVRYPHVGDEDALAGLVFCIEQDGVHRLPRRDCLGGDGNDYYRSLKSYQ